MKIPQQDRRRSFFATLCLVAVVLLYAPLAGAAWSLNSTACCTVGQCPVHGYHHQHSPASSRKQGLMDCGREMPGMSKCTMSCCHDSDHPAIAPVMFVLPPAVSVSAPSSLKSCITFSKPSNDLRSIEPLSPPPRLSAAAA